MKLHTAFVDADGQPNLEQIVEIAQALPEAIKTVPMEKLHEIMPMLQEVVAMSGGPSSAPESEQATDEEYDKDEEMTDEYKDKEKVPVTDTADFKDAVDKAVKAATRRHAEVIEKASDFVDEAYSFKDKSTEQIMRDAVKTEYGDEQFNDQDLSVAFKMLKRKQNSLANFGDSAAASKFDQLADKEL